MRPLPSVLFRSRQRLSLARGLAGGLALVGVLPLLGLSWQGVFLMPGDVMLRLGLAVGAVAVALVLLDAERRGPRDLPMGARLHEAERRLVHLAAGEGNGRGRDRLAPVFAALALVLLLVAAVWSQFNAL